LLINAMPLIKEAVKIPVGINVSEAGNYQFSFSNADRFSYGNKLYLVDTYTGITVPVSDGTPYAFTVTLPAK
jgi:hypothetical protein